MMRRFFLALALIGLSCLPAGAAITVTPKIFEATTTDGTSFVSVATWSVTTNALGICFAGTIDATTPGTLTLTQTGQTWDAVDATNAHELFDTIGTPLARFQAFRTLGAGAAAATVSLIVTGGTGNHTGFVLLCSEFAGQDTSGSNGSGAIIQSKDGSVDNTVDPTVTFDSGRTANSAVIFASMSVGDACTTWAGEGGYTLGNATETNFASPTVESLYEYVVGGSDTSPSFDQTGACTAPEIGSIAIEIKEAAAGGAQAPGSFGSLGVGR